MHVGAVITVTELDRAREFYEGKLGLVGEPAPGGWAVRADRGSVTYLLSTRTPISAGTSGMKVAWLRDSDGSILTVFSPAG